MSVRNKRVRIIKRAERECTAQQLLLEETKTANQLQRDMAGTVASWIANRKDLDTPSLKFVFQLSEE